MDMTETHVTALRAGRGRLLFHDMMMNVASLLHCKLNGSMCVVERVEGSLTPFNGQSGTSQRFSFFVQFVPYWLKTWENKTSNP